MIRFGPPPSTPARRRGTGPAGTVDEEGIADLADPSPGAEARAIESDRRGLLRTALRGLSAINREIVVLRDVHGLDVKQVASILGVPLGTVKSRASRARVELAERVLALARGRGEA